MMDPARLTAFSGLRTLPGGAQGPATAPPGVPGFALDLLPASVESGPALPAEVAAMTPPDRLLVAGAARQMTPAAGVATKGMLARLHARSGAAEPLDAMPMPAAPAQATAAPVTTAEAGVAAVDDVASGAGETAPVATAALLPVAAPSGGTLSLPVSGAVAAGGDDGSDPASREGATLADSAASASSRAPAIGGAPAAVPPATGSATDPAGDHVSADATGASDPGLPTGAAPGSGGRSAQEADAGNGTGTSGRQDAAATGEPQRLGIVQAGMRGAPARQASAAPGGLVSATPATPPASSGEAGAEPQAAAPLPVARVADGGSAAAAPAQTADDAAATMPPAGAAQPARKAAMQGPARPRFAAADAAAEAAADAAAEAGLTAAGKEATAPALRARPSSPAEGAVAPAAGAPQGAPSPAETELAERAAGAGTDAAGDGGTAVAEGASAKGAGEADAPPDPVARTATTPPAPLAESAAAFVEPAQPAPPAPPAAQAEAAQPGGAAADGATALDAAWRQMVLDVQKQGWTQALVRRVAGLASTGGTLAVQVYPPALGRMVIRVAETSRGLDLRVSSELAATAAMMGEAEQRISQLLESAGLRLADYTSQTGGAGAEARGEGGNGSQRAPDDAAGTKAAGPRGPAEDAVGVADRTPAGAVGRVDLIA